MNAQGRGIVAPPHEQSTADTGGVRLQKSRTSWKERIRHAFMRVFFFFPFKPYVPPNGVTPAEAVTSFLGTMAANAARTSPAWVKMLATALDESGVSYDARHDFFETRPVEDYYFTGTVALEAVRIRTLYPPREANTLLSEIGAQIDAAAKRDDRVLSEMLFDVIGRIRISQGATLQKMPYDIVTKSILQQLEIGKTDATRHLLSDKGFRHALGEPLALGFRNWWAAFQSKFVLYEPPTAEEAIPGEDDEMPAAAPAPAKLPWRPKRAASF